MFWQALGRLIWSNTNTVFCRSLIPPDWIPPNLVEENELFDFQGLRLDWFRLQAYTSVAKAGLLIKDHKDLARHMNTIIFHTKMVDYLDEMLIETSDLSLYWWDLYS